METVSFVTDATLINSDIKMKSIDSLAVGDKLIRLGTKEIFPILGIVEEEDIQLSKLCKTTNFMFFGFNVYKKGIPKFFETIDGKCKVIYE